jgi:hypothetical protein
MSESSAEVLPWLVPGSDFKTELSTGRNGETEPKAGRFWKKADRSQHSPGGCWLWIGARNNLGYGVFAVELRPTRLALAHRVAFALAVGPVPRGLVVRHRCDTPSCVNPDHLLLGTQKHNVADCIERGRFMAGGLTPERFNAARRARLRPLRQPGAAS